MELPAPISHWLLSAIPRAELSVALPCQTRTKLAWLAPFDHIICSSPQVDLVLGLLSLSLSLCELQISSARCWPRKEREKPWRKIWLERYGKRGDRELEKLSGHTIKFD
jgi:hypothetical protein